MIKTFSSRIEDVTRKKKKKTRGNLDAQWQNSDYIYYSFHLNQFKVCLKFKV